MSGWQATEEQVYLNTYARYPLLLVRGEGTRVWDHKGREYLDFLAGIGVTALGHCHPEVVDAIRAQASTLIHTSNLYGTLPGTELAQLLIAHGGLDRVFLCNSGTEAVEAAIKLVRKYHARRGQPHRHGVISMEGSFHGRTLGALAATGKPALKEGFGPMPAGFRHVPWNDPAALEAAMDDTVAAVFIEPVKGEGGIHPADPKFLAAARRITTEAGALLVFDEIQCGIGRTGSLFAYQHYGITPDVITLAKGLGGGMPIGAVCTTREAAVGFGPGDHGTTFGGNPVSCAAATAVLKVILRDDLAAHAGAMGARLVEGLKAGLAGHPAVKEIRGRGLMLGIELACDAKQVLEACREAGLLANVTEGTVLRLLPPLTVSAPEVDRAVAVITAAVEQVAGPGVRPAAG